MEKRQVARWLLMLLMLGLAVTAVACGALDTGGFESDIVKAGQTISSDSKWINSDIDGAIDAETPTNLKDDFHTAVNRDWLLNTTLQPDEYQVSRFTGSSKLIRERKLSIIRNGPEAAQTSGASEENNMGLTADQLAHNQELVSVFADLAGNWDARNAQGVEPARAYVDAIAGIGTMDAMTAYMMNEDGMNLCQNQLVGIDVTQPPNGGDQNTVAITTGVALTLQNQDEYANITDAGMTYKEYNNEKVTYLLGRLGYDEGSIRHILSGCYQFEGRLAAAMADTTTQSSLDYLKQSDNTYTLDQISEIQGNYPLTQLLAHYKLDGSERYTVYEPEYVKAVGNLYSDQYLEEFKCYTIVHTASEILPLLDRDAYDKYAQIQAAMTGKMTTNDSGDKNPDGSQQTTSDDETAILLDDFIGVYLAEPMDEIYVAQYCSAQQKAEIKTLIDQVLRQYRTMLQDEDWLSEETQNAAVEKLDNISVRAVYPDTFTDYSGLTLSRTGSLLDAMTAINDYAWDQISKRVNTPVDRNAWDLAAMSTTVVNAYYNPKENSINILAGVMADGFFYNTAMTQEEKLARIGFIIGHEITHAFDDTGSRFDKDGRQNSWWSYNDITAFQERSTKLGKTYAVMTPYPGATSYTSNTTGEAIADMGGMKCMLAIARDIPGFDYRRFFEYYAGNWSNKTTYEVEKNTAESDVHPLGFLRTNMTVQQFDEFMDAYGVTQGDGMYLAPENRILVW